MKITLQIVGHNNNISTQTRERNVVDYFVEYGIIKEIFSEYRRNGEYNIDSIKECIAYDKRES